MYSFLNQKKKKNLNNIFFSFSFFQDILKKFSTSTNLLNFISLLQLSYLTENKIDIIKNQQYLNFLNKLYFFFDIFQIIEEPFNQFWYTLFTSFEIGEFTTQKQILLKKKITYLKS